jgi:hypothetical protein
MIHPSTFLSRALLADAIFSGVAAVALTLGAGSARARSSTCQKPCCARPACS